MPMSLRMRRGPITRWPVESAIVGAAAWGLGCGVLGQQFCGGMYWPFAVVIMASGIVVVALAGKSFKTIRKE